MMSQNKGGFVTLLISSEATLHIITNVRHSVQMSGSDGNVIYSAANQNRGLFFSLQIPLAYGHLFCK